MTMLALLSGQCFFFPYTTLTKLLACRRASVLLEPGANPFQAVAHSGKHTAFPICSISGRLDQAIPTWRRRHHNGRRRPRSPENIYPCRKFSPICRALALTYMHRYQVYPMDKIQDAHRDMESNTTAGKLIVTVP